MPVPQVTLLSDVFTGTDGTAIATYDAHYVTSLLGTTKTAQLLTNQLRLAGSDGAAADVFRIYRDDFYVYDLDASWVWTLPAVNSEIYTHMLGRGPSGWGTSVLDGPASGTSAISANLHPFSGAQDFNFTLHHSNDTFTTFATFPVTYTDGHAYGVRWRMAGGLHIAEIWDITAGGTLATATPYAGYDGTGETIDQYGRFAYGTNFGTAAVARTLDLDTLVVKTHAHDYPYPVRDRGGFANTSTGTTDTLTLGSPTTIKVGNYLFIRVAADNSGVAGVAPGLTLSDSRSNTWTVLGPAVRNPSATTDTGSCAFFAYALVTTAYQAGDTISFTWSVTTPGVAAECVEWANVHATSPIAVAAVSANGNSTTPSVSITPLATNQVVLGVLAVEGPVADTWTADTDTTDGAWFVLSRGGGGDATATNNQTVSGQAKVVQTSGTPAAQTFSPTLGTARNWAALAVVLAPDDTQIVIPDGDTTGTGWTTAAGASSPLYAQVDEIPADDLDYVKATLA